MALHLGQQFNLGQISSRDSATFRNQRPISKPFFRQTPIFLRVLLISFSLALATQLTGCAALSEREEAKKNGPFSRVYFATYEEVEIALKQAMIRYPQKIDNTEAGIFETDFIKGDARFRPPHKEVKFSPGYRYRLLVRLVRGRSDDKQQATKVQIVKKVEVARDFFSEPEAAESDGLEEQVILYRIGRELQLARAVAKATDKKNRPQK